MHWLGMLGMPRGGDADPAVHFWNCFFESFSSYLMTIAILIFVNVLWSIRNGKRSGANPWGARTLEWQIPSPPNYYNFKHILMVYGLPTISRSHCHKGSSRAHRSCRRQSRRSALIGIA